MQRKFTILTQVGIVLALAGLFTLLAFANKKHNQIICSSIVIDLDNVYDNHFIDKSDIVDVLENSALPPLGARIGEINLRQLERNLEISRYISNVQLYNTIKGTLVVSVQLRKPVARLLSKEKDDAYIAKDGMLLPMSDKFTARTMLISGNLVERLNKLDNINQNAYGKQLMQVIRYIDNNAFWTAQVAQLYIDENNHLIIYPQVTDQKIKFGDMNDIEIKFRKLMVFYTRILPQKGWTKYDQVNVQYGGQIVAQ